MIKNHPQNIKTKKSKRFIEILFVLPLLFSITDPIIAVLVSAIGGSGPALVAIVLSGAIKPKKLEVQNLKRWAIFIMLLVLISFFWLFYT